MRFFNIDQHASVIADVGRIFSSLGHTVDDWSLSGHHWVLGKEKHEIPVLAGHGPDPEVADAFYETYREKLAGYDGFICCYPASYAMLYRRWDKPTIVVNCVRYEIPYSGSPEGWARWNGFIRRRIGERKLWWVCNNKGDAWYVNYFTGIDPVWIPSLCEYVAEKWTGTKDRFLLYGRPVGTLPDVSPDLYVHSDSPVLKGSDWRFSWKDVYAYRGIIHLPYQNGTMSIFEHYTANAPMFFPSKAFLYELFDSSSIGVLADLSFLPAAGLPEPTQPGNPNNLSDPTVVRRWIDSCDFYDRSNMPHVQLFDSFPDLERQLRSVDSAAVSREMARYNEIRRELVHRRWQRVLHEIEGASAVSL